MNPPSVDTRPKPFVFVLMPFNKNFDDIYDLGIHAACLDANAHCERVDKQFFKETILQRIYNQIAKADLLVAEMTGKNPNVFYEVGYAHALGQDVILLTKKASDIPFDLKHFPHIVYKSISGLKTDLTKRVKWVIENPKQSSRLPASAADGPFGKYSGFIQEVEFNGWAEASLPQALAAELKSEHFQFEVSDDGLTIECPGFRSYCYRDQDGIRYAINVHHDIVLEVFPVLIPILEKHARKTLSVTLQVIEGVAATGSGVGWTARARNTEFRVEPYRFRFRQHHVSARGPITVSGDSLPSLSTLKDVVTALFDSTLIDFNPNRPRVLTLQAQSEFLRQRAME